MYQKVSKAAPQSPETKPEKKKSQIIQTQLFSLSVSFCSQFGSITTPELFKKRRLSAAKSFEQSQSQQEKRDARETSGACANLTQKALAR